MTDTSQPASGKPLSRRTLACYGLADMPIQMGAIPVLAFVPNYYGADLGLSLVVVGTILFATRLFDAVSDPLVGYLSDRTNTRWGRRRVWMAASVPVLMLAVYKLFMPAPPVDAWYLLIWLTTFWAGWTMLFIPYYSWAAELSPDYNERTRITGWRAWIGMVANVVSKLVPVLAIFLFDFGGTRETLLLIGTMMLVMVPITVGTTIFTVPERRDFVPTRIPLLPGLRIMWQNGPFKRLVLAFFVNQLGSATSTALVVFFIRNVLQEEQSSILMLLCFFGANLCGIPFWIWLSERIGKHRAWAISLFLFAALQCMYLTLGAGDFVYMMPIMAATGFCGGSFLAVPNSMKADVIDLDKLSSGEDRAAWYFAVWSFTMKIGNAIGPGIALSLLWLVGFDASVASSTPEAVEGLLGLKLLYVFGPALGFFLSGLIVWHHPLTQKRQEEIRAQLQAT